VGAFGGAQYRAPEARLAHRGQLAYHCFCDRPVWLIEAISIAKAIAAKTRERINPNQELIGQGLANVAASLTHAFPVSGSFSRSALNLNAGAVTGMSSVFSGLVMLLTLLLLTPLLYYLPQSVLAAVIMMAVVGLINFNAIRHAWEAHKHDGIASAFVCTRTRIRHAGASGHLVNGAPAGPRLSPG
jgi:SulP family sulfate permease